MNKIIIIILGVLCLSLHGDLFAGPKNKLSKKQDELRIKNEKIVKEYIGELKKQTTPTVTSFDILKGFSREELLKYNVEGACEEQGFKRLKELDKLLKFQDKLIAKDKEYKTAVRESRKIHKDERETFLRRAKGAALTRASRSDEYLKAAKKYNKEDETLFIMFLEHLVKVYKQENKTLPVDWIK